MKSNAKPRVRWPLLVLLWIWAACVFLTVDLFRNVEEFDAIRPRSMLYRATRYAAHKMVDEPNLDPAFAEARPSPRIPTIRVVATVPPLRREINRVKRMGAERDFDALVREASTSRDPRLRVAAMRVLAESFGVESRGTLLERTWDATQPDWVRAQGARFVGWTGDGALESLEALLRARLPEAVQAGALRGLGRVRTAEAARCALLWSEKGTAALRSAAVRAVAGMATPEAAPELIAAAADTSRRSATRIAACQALAAARTRSATGTLAALAADPSAEQSLRTAARQALDRMK